MLVARTDEQRTRADTMPRGARDRQGACYEERIYSGVRACGRRTAETRPPGEPGEERTRRKKRRRWKRELERRRNGRHTEGTCYALRDMAEARGIHNFVKTKMLRSCLGGVAFFLVSRNVQARLSLLLPPFLVPAVPHSCRLLVPSRPPARLSFSPSPPFPPLPLPHGFLSFSSSPSSQAECLPSSKFTSAHHPFLVSPVMRRGMRNVL